VLSGLIAGLYPATLITSFDPSLILKGSFGLSRKGRKIRNLLIGFQFIASFALIIIVSFMFLQNRFMQKSPLGYDKDLIITTDIQAVGVQRQLFINEVMSYPDVKGISFSYSLLANSQDSYTGFGREYNGMDVSFNILEVYYNFFEVMGIDFKGRLEDMDLDKGVFVFNETARKTYNLELNTFIPNIPNVSNKDCEIAGFLPDVHFQSMRKEIGPMAFLVTNKNRFLDQAYIKLHAGANISLAIQHIKNSIEKVVPVNPYPSEIVLFDEVMNRLYEKEISLNRLISLFSLVTIVVSIMGIFGLVIFDSESRRKEIGIRKVLGATSSGIIVMFNNVYLKILFYSFVIASPIAWYVIHRWFENFAYKMPIHWWVFALAFVVITAITAGTVTFLNWRVANDDPVNAIKSE
jgi:putative ABC transport system permease protein